MVTQRLEHYEAADLIGVMMTGMGDDGSRCDDAVAPAGLAAPSPKPKSTAVVWGMPGELVKNGGAEIVRPVEDIAAR